MPYLSAVKQLPWETNIEDTSVNITALRFSGAIEFGSRALDVHQENSDYDFAMLRNNFEIFFKDNMPDEYLIKHYFKVVPPKGNNTLVSKLTTSDNKYLDILVLEHQEHLNMIAQAIQDMRNKHFQSWGKPYIPYLNKQYRIKVFEQELLKQGFRTRWPVLIANWLMKIF